MNNNKTFNLQDGETIITTVRPNWTAATLPFIAIFICIFLMISGTSVFALSTGKLLNLSENAAEAAIQIERFILTAAIVLCIYAIMEELSATYTLTDRRIISSYGTFTKKTEEIPLAKCLYAEHKQDFIQRITNIGNIIITTTGNRTMELGNIKNANELRFKIEIQIVMTKISTKED